MSNTKNNQEKSSTFSTLIQIAVGFYLMFIGGQALFAQTSDQKLKFDDFKKTTITFGGKYSENIYRINSNSQIINLSPESLVKFGEALEKALVKANEWFTIAQENNVEKMKKVMPIEGYTTDGGMIYDSGYKSTHDKDAMEFTFEKYKDIATISMRVHQYESVYSAFFNFSRIYLNKEDDLSNLNNFIAFAKNNKSILEEKINSTKQDLFN